MVFVLVVQYIIYIYINVLFQGALSNARVCVRSITVVNDEGWSSIVVRLGLGVDSMWIVSATGEL